MKFWLSYIFGFVYGLLLVVALRYFWYALFLFVLAFFRMLKVTEDRTWLPGFYFGLGTGAIVGATVYLSVRSSLPHLPMF
jgi:hypothetical protein